METKEKQFLYKDEKQASFEANDAKKILKPLESLMQWYKENGFEFDFAELQRIVETKDLKEFFWAKFNLKSYPTIQRRSLEPYVKEAVEKVLPVAQNTDIKRIINTYNVTKSDIDLTKMAFTAAFQKKIEKRNTYYVESETEAKLMELLNTISNAGNELKKLVSSEYGRNTAIVQPQNADIKLFNEETTLKPDLRAVVRLRKTLRANETQESLNVTH